MSGRHGFQWLIARFTSERQCLVEAKKAELMAETPLRAMRQAIAVIQLRDANQQDFRDIREMVTESHGGHDDR